MTGKQRIAFTTRNTLGERSRGRPFLAIFLGLFLAAAVFASAADRSSVTILNDKFQVIKVLNSSRSKHAFRAIWSKKKKVRPPDYPFQWHYKIDMADGARWLYDPRGFTMLATPKKVPLYRLPSPNRFNSVIGARVERRD